MINFNLVINSFIAKLSPSPNPSFSLGLRWLYFQLIVPPTKKKYERAIKMNTFKTKVAIPCKKGPKILLDLTATPEIAQKAPKRSKMVSIRPELKIKR